MTWNDLVYQISKMSDKQKENQVPIFNFNMGEMELLNSLNEVGESNVDNHCEDIRDFKGQFYLLCGLSQ